MQRGVAKGPKVPCLFMITEVSIHCQKNPEVGIRRIPAYTPQYTTGYDMNTVPTITNIIYLSTSSKTHTRLTALCPGLPG